MIICSVMNKELWILSIVDEYGCFLSLGKEVIQTLGIVRMLYRDQLQF
jgi:hypothetical protein